MVRRWIGPAQYLFIPLIVQNVPGYLPPPGDYDEFVQRRVYYDPDPVTNLDRSISSYFAEVSYGRASINARVSEPVVIDSVPADGNMTLAAIKAQANSHLYEYLAVVYPANNLGEGSGMAHPGKIEFNPPRTPNRTKARSRFLFDAPTGTYAMEIMHNVTDIGDYYNGLNHPDGYDEMADSQAQHPSAYTKLEAGWLDSESVPRHTGGAENYALHALALPHPASAGRVAALKIQAQGSNRYLIIEARLRSDRWDGGFFATKAIPEARNITYPGIPAEGVLIMEFSPETDSWPRQQPGPWPPLERRAVLGVGQTFNHFDSSTTDPGVVDHRSGLGRQRSIAVRSQIAGGFVIDVTTDEAGRPPRVSVPLVLEFSSSHAGQVVSAADLVPKFTGDPQGPNAWVWRQSPNPGTEVDSGSTVTMQLRTGPRQ